MKSIKKLKEERKFIPAQVFKQILEWLPIATSDFVPTRLCNGKKEFLLGQRREAPFKGNWFVTGGRLNWGEHPDEACLRHARRELGLEKIRPQFVGHFSVFNPESAERPFWHSIWHLYEIKLTGDEIIKPNRENARVRWFSKIDPRWPKPVREALRTMGFK